MTTRSKYFEQIRISKDPKKTSAQAQECQWDSCTKPGVHRAPVGRMAEKEYFVFCLEHVRKYNRDFNYFSGLEDSEIARFQKEAISGHRPTWKIEKEDIKHKTSVFYAGQSGNYKTKNQSPFLNTSASQKGAACRNEDYTLRPLEISALETLGLDKTATKITIRARYAELVKRHHPDFNGGDRTSEDQFREVLNAYRILKKSNLC